MSDSQINLLMEIIKILGTPSKTEVSEMNKDYSMESYSLFPLLKKVNLKSVLKTKDPKAIDLIDKMLQYSPQRRLTPGKALLHEFFD